MSGLIPEMSWGRWWVPVVVAVALVVVGCGGEGGHAPSVTRALAVHSEIGVAALDVRGVAVSKALEFVGVRVLSEDMLAWSHVSDDGTFAVGVISAAAVQGEMLALVFEERELGAAPEDVKLVAYDEEGAELPAEAVRAAWVTYEVAGLHEPEAVVVSWDAALAEDGVQVHGYR